MSKKRNLALCLSLLLLASGIATGCGSNTGDSKKENDTQNDNTAAETAVETETEKVSALSTIPVVDYNGYVFHVLHENQENQQVDIETAGEENGDVLNDLVFRRNSLIEDTYHIKIDATNAEGSKVNETIQKQVTAGLNEIDLYFHNCTVMSVASSGYLYNLYDLPNLDLSNAWWDKAALNGLSISNMAYLATGDISPTSLMTTSCLAFNKNLFNTYDLEYPYDMVREGTWTIDVFLEMTKNLSRDMNGDGEMKYGDDLYSYSGWCYDNSYALFYGAGGMLSEKDAEDIPHVSYDFDKITSIYDKIYTIIIDHNSYYVKDFGIYPQAYSNFANGNAFFCDTTFFKIDRNYREMEDDFGLVPNPKYDTAQEHYISVVNGAGDYIVVPNNPADAERTGLITEALAASAHDGITPSLYDIIIKGKNTRDEDSVEMINIVISNRVFDPCFINYIPGYNFTQTLLDKKSKEVISTLTKSQDKADKALQKIVDAYMETKNH